MHALIIRPFNNHETSTYPLFFKMYRQVFTIFLAFSTIIGRAISEDCHETLPGQCPTLEPVQNFDMNKMLGTWYSIEKTCTTSQCIVYNISETTTVGEYKIESISLDSIIFNWVPIKRNSYSAATLKITDKPGKLEVIYPFKISGKATFTIFSADYSDNAGIFVCQNGWSSNHKKSAEILSRSRTLDRKQINNIRDKLFENEINPFDLSIVKQENCTNSPGDSSWSSFRAELVRRAGNTVTNGVSFVSDTGRGIYDKVTGVFHDIGGNVGNAGDTAIQSVQNAVERARGYTQKSYEAVEENVRRGGEKARDLVGAGKKQLDNAAIDADEVYGSVGNYGNSFRDSAREAEENALRNYGKFDRGLAENVDNLRGKN